VPGISEGWGDGDWAKERRPACTVTNAEWLTLVAKFGLAGPLRGHVTSEMLTFTGFQGGSETEFEELSIPVDQDPLRGFLLRRLSGRSTSCRSRTLPQRGLERPVGRGLDQLVGHSDSGRA
jgi:hypothetical protein